MGRLKPGLQPQASRKDIDTMSVREPTESLFSWPLWVSIALVGLLLVFVAPHGLTARNDAEQPAAAQKAQPGDVEGRLRRLEDKLDRLLQGLAARGEAPQESRERVVAS